MEAFIKFFFVHINTIIYVLALITVILLGIMIFLNLGSESEGSPDPESRVDHKKISDLEALLKKMLESAQLPKATVSNLRADEPQMTTAPTPDPTATPVVVKELDTTALNEMKAQVESLKNTLNEKELTISKLKSSLELAQQEQLQKGDSNPQLHEKLRELEAKLAEYEIIEDDIADLTMYKEENARLKEQLNQLMKAQSLQAPTSTAPPNESSPPSNMASANSQMPQSPQATESPQPSGASQPLDSATVAQATTLGSEILATSPVPASSGEVVSDDLLNQFKAAISEPTKALSEQKPAAAANSSEVSSVAASSTSQSSSMSDTPPVGTGTSPTAASPTATTSQIQAPSVSESSLVNKTSSQQVVETVNDDLMAEFEKALSEQRKVENAHGQIANPIPTFPIHGVEAGQETHDVMAEFITDVVDSDGAVSTKVHMELENSTLTAGNDPLAAVDSNKMISEVESMTQVASALDQNVLEKDTDTDKMLQEMEELKKLAAGD